MSDNILVSGEHKNFWKTIWHFMRPYRSKAIFGSCCAILVGIAVAIQPLMIRYIIDSGIARKGASIQEKLVYTAVFVAIYLFVSLFRIGIWAFGYRRMMIVVEGVLFSIRSRFFRHIQRLCLRFHDQVSSGELFNYLMGSPISALQMFLRQFMMTAPYAIVSWVVVLAVLGNMDWQMTGIVLAVVITTVLISRRSQYAIENISADFMHSESEVSKYLADMLHGCRAIKIYTMENRVIDAFDNNINKIRWKGVNLMTRQNIEGRKPEGVQYLGMAAVYIAGAYSCIYRNLTIGEFVAFTGSVQLFMGPLLIFFQLMLIKANAEAGVNRIMKILEIDKSLQELPVDNHNKISDHMSEAKTHDIPCIQFSNVTFAYGDRPVFKGLSCSIEDGQSVALVGPSGYGKSTFVNLLLRLYDPQAGYIAIYGKNLHTYSFHEIRSSFGVVPQDPYLFQMSVFENIRVGKPDASKEEVERAMKIAHVDEFVELLPQGDQTAVGENGCNLSGGQRQRIAIARAIIGTPRFLIFDEATSALDSKTEACIQKAMAELIKNHTTIIIAHRLATVRHVDRILVFENGCIAQDGPYDELARHKGLFQELVLSTLQ